MGRPLVDKETPYSEMGRRIRAARLARGLSQAQVAASLGFSAQGSFQKIESGLNAPTVEVLLTLHSLLGITPNEVLLGVASIPEAPALPPVTDEEVVQAYREGLDADSRLDEAIREHRGKEERSTAPAAHLPRQVAAPKKRRAR